jgi:splicing factor 3A subunit 2
MRSYHMRIGCKYCQCCFLPETLSLASAPVSSAGKRHQQNLAKRAAREAAEKPVAPAPQRRVAIKKTVRIGRPGYRVTKQFDHDTGARGLLFQVLLLHHKLP